MTDHPPCWRQGQPCPNSCAKERYQRIVHGRTELHGPWAGWRIAGRELITPQRDRIDVDHVAHLIHMATIRAHFESVGLQAQANRAKRKRLQREQQIVRVVVVDLDAWRARHGLSVA